MLKKSILFTTVIVAGYLIGSTTTRSTFATSPLPQSDPDVLMRVAQAATSNSGNNSLNVQQYFNGYIYGLQARMSNREAQIADYLSLISQSKWDSPDRIRAMGFFDGLMTTPPHLFQ